MLCECCLSFFFARTLRRGACHCGVESELEDGTAGIRTCTLMAGSHMKNAYVPTGGKEKSAPDRSSPQRRRSNGLHFVQSSVSTLHCRYVAHELMRTEEGKGARTRQQSHVRLSAPFAMAPSAVDRTQLAPTKRRHVATPAHKRQSARAKRRR